MRFRFCGDADCPDWILAEINSLSKLSSIKLKQLAQIILQGVIKPPIDLTTAEKLFTDSRKDSSIDLKACVACLCFIITSATRFNCDSKALHSELQQLGLPREHSSSIKRVIDDHYDLLVKYFKDQSLQVNPLSTLSVDVDSITGCVIVNLNLNGKFEKVTILPHTLNILLEDLKKARTKLEALNTSNACLGFLF